MELKFFFAVVGIMYIASAAKEDYCDPSLCEDGLTHIACDHDQEFSKECGYDPDLLILSAPNKKLILDLHNRHRNQVASGRLSGYSAAAQMPSIRWNEDLAYTASLHARTCSTERDECRNSKRFKEVGQNVGHDINGEHQKNVIAVIKNIVESWFLENKNGDQADIKKLPEDKLSSMGRFLMMVNDRTADIGCALVKFKVDDVLNVLFTCNYGSNINLDQKIYESGTRCSKCKTGCSKTWTALCSPSEKVSYHSGVLKNYN